MTTMGRSKIFIEPVLDAVNSDPSLDKEKLKKELNDRDSRKAILAIFTRLFPEIPLGNKEVSRLVIEKTHLESTIQNYWSIPLRMLLLEIELARAALAYFGEHVSLKIPADKRNLESALFFLQRRACVVASEILCLLESGYADGAESRWRTLNEMAITSEFLFHNGDKFAERYAKYRAVVELKKNRNLKEQAEKYLLNPGPNQSQRTKESLKSAIESYSKAIKHLEEEVTQLCEQFGPSFKNSNGWAAAAFPNNHKDRRVHLDEIANKVTSSTTIPYCRLSMRAFANDNVHQGSVGDIHSRGDFGPRNTVLLGASPVGMYMPISNTAEDLAITTYMLLSIYPTWQCGVINLMIKIISDSISAIACEREKGVIEYAKSLKELS